MTEIDTDAFDKGLKEAARKEAAKYEHELRITQPEEGRPSCLPSCGTQFRGCDPACPSRVYELEVEVRNHRSVLNVMDDRIDTVYERLHQMVEKIDSLAAAVDKLYEAAAAPVEDALKRARERIAEEPFPSPDYSLADIHGTIDDDEDVLEPMDRPPKQRSVARMQMEMMELRRAAARAKTNEAKMREHLADVKRVAERRQLADALKRLSSYANVARWFESDMPTREDWDFNGGIRLSYEHPSFVLEHTEDTTRIPDSVAAAMLANFEDYGDNE